MHVVALMILLLGVLLPSLACAQSNRNTGDNGKNEYGKRQTWKWQTNPPPQPGRDQNHPRIYKKASPKGGSEAWKGK